MDVLVCALPIEILESTWSEHVSRCEINICQCKISVTRNRHNRLWLSRYHIYISALQSIDNGCISMSCIYLVLSRVRNN